MNRFLVPLGVFGLLVVVLALGIKHSPDKGNIPSPLIGKPAPRFSLPSLADARHTIGTDQLRGRWYLFNVWATWCGGCRAEHEMLLEVRRSGAVHLIGMDWKDEDAAAARWLEQLGNPYEAVAVDHEGRTAIDWGVYGAPETFLVNDQGVVVHKFIGPLTREAWEREFLPLLPPKSGRVPS